MPAAARSCLGPRVPGASALHRINLLKSDAAFRLAARAWGGSQAAAVEGAGAGEGAGTEDAAVVSAILARSGGGGSESNIRECALVDVLAVEDDEDAEDDEDVGWSRSLALRTGGGGGSGAFLVWEVSSSRARLRGLLSDVMKAMFDGTKEITGVWLRPVDGDEVGVAARVGVRAIRPGSSLSPVSTTPRPSSTPVTRAAGGGSGGDGGEGPGDWRGAGFTPINLLAAAAAAAGAAGAARAAGGGTAPPRGGKPLQLVRRGDAWARAVDHGWCLHPTPNTNPPPPPPLAMR